MSLDAMKQALEALERGETKLRYQAIEALRAAIEQAQPDARTLHKIMQAMMKEHWRSIDTQWKDDPELCHALGYEAGYNDAVAPRVEPRASGSGAGFESLPASPHKLKEKNT